MKLDFKDISYLVVPCPGLADNYFVQTCILVVRAENGRIMLISDDCIMFCNFAMHVNIVRHYFIYYYEQNDTMIYARQLFSQRQNVMVLYNF